MAQLNKLGVMGSRRRKPAPLRFGALRLNFHSDEAWAVVSHPAGAIARSASGALLMRLTKAEARRIADQMTESLRKGEPRRVAEQ